jgi:hypothetical protein
LPGSAKTGLHSRDISRAIASGLRPAKRISRREKSKFKEEKEGNNHLE